MKWNYYPQGAKIIVHNDHKPLARFLNGKNANNKVNRWGLELAFYNITFKWISGTQIKAADCLSRLVKLHLSCTTLIQQKYIVDKDASDDACGAQLSQEHDGTEFPIAFLSRTFTDTQRK